MHDPERLCRELVRHLRGGRSQRALSRRLQYTTNVVYLWESGRRWPTGAGLLWLVHRTGGDVAAALECFAPGCLDGLASPPWSPEAIAALLRHLKGSMTAAELAERVGRSRDSVGRWLRGQSEPRLPDLLLAIEATSTRSLDFVALFADPAALPSVSEAWDRLEAARRLTRELPWAPAVLLALELADYQALDRHEDRWLAQRLGLPEAEIADSLRILEVAGQIHRRRGRWVRVEVQAVDSRSPTRPMDLKRWWTQVALERMERAEGTASFTICAISQQDFARLQALQRRHYRDLRALIAASAPGERIVLLNLHTLALDDPAGGDAPADLAPGDGAP